MTTLPRLFYLAARRSFSTTSTARFLVSSKQCSDKHFADPLEHATGLEKRQLLARMEGNDDPFDLSVAKFGVGTLKEPNVVYSVNHERIVGCICEPDSTHINWMWLKDNEVKRCGCGKYFKLVHKEAL